MTMTTNPRQRIRELAESWLKCRTDNPGCDCEWCEDALDKHRQITAILNSKDWVCVPREPTEAMLNAPGNVWPPEAKIIWAQMLAAGEPK